MSGEVLTDFIVASPAGHTEAHPPGHFEAQPPGWVRGGEAGNVIISPATQGVIPETRAGIMYHLVV